MIKDDSTDLELFALRLIRTRLEREERVFVFSAGNLRGKLVSIEHLDSALPAATYQDCRSTDQQMEPCVQLTYAPRPKDPGKVTDPTKFKFTRKPVLFNIPVRVVSGSLLLKKLYENVWMVNVQTSARG